MRTRVGNVLAPHGRGRGRSEEEKINKLTTRASSPSSSLMTAEKLLEVISRNSQQLRIERLSHPDVGCSWIADKSRFRSWKSLNWRRVRKSSGRVKRSLSRLSDELISLFFAGEGGKEGDGCNVLGGRTRFSYDFFRGNHRLPLSITWSAKQ